MRAQREPGPGLGWLSRFLVRRECYAAGDQRAEGLHVDVDALCEAPRDIDPTGVPELAVFVDVLRIRTLDNRMDDYAATVFGECIVLDSTHHDLPVVDRRVFAQPSKLISDKLYGEPGSTRALKWRIFEPYEMPLEHAAFVAEIRADIIARDDGGQAGDTPCAHPRTHDPELCVLVQTLAAGSVHPDRDQNGLNVVG